MEILIDVMKATEDSKKQGPFGYYEMKNFTKFFCTISQCYIAMMELIAPEGSARTKVVTTKFDQETGKIPVSQQVIISVGYGPNPLTRKELRGAKHINHNYVKPPIGYVPVKTIYEKN